MELSLSRVDLLQVGSTARNNVRLLPISKKSTQKVVVGDNDGNVTCFGMKKGKADQSFKSGPLTKECTALSLGGGAKGNNFIFAAHGRNITGFSRKGKNIYEHQSPQTEDINNLQVIQSEERIFAAGDFVLTETAHGREENLFMANDKINGMLLQKPGASYETILACQDRQVRVVRGSTLVNEIGVAGPATVVTSFDTNSAFDQEFAVEERKGHQTRLAMEVEELKAKLRAADDSEAAQLEEELHTKTRELESHSANGEQNRREVLYGTESGMVGLITFVPDGQGADGSVLQHGWSIPNVRRLGGINCMGTCDITKDGRTDMLVGRDDGTLEIWSMDMGVEPSLIFSKCINESISGVECGLITAAASEDVLLSTFSGKIIAFSAATAPGPETAVADGDKKEKKKKKSKDTEDVEKGAVKRVTDKDVKKLNKELDELKKKLEKEKAKFQSGASKEQPKELIATKNSMRLKESFMLDAEDACYQLTVEIESAIDCVVLQSTAQVELVDIDSNVAIVSKTPPESDASKSSKVLATFRCQEPTRRMQIKVRTTEGQNGKLTAFVVPDVAPKTSMSIRHSVKTLSLHMRVQEAELAGDARPLSSLTIQGNFSIEKAHAWCANCLPEVPERLQGTEARFFFRATFVPSILKCAYRKGEAVFSSDSLKTLAILKDYVTREATASNLAINIKTDISTEGVEHFLRMVGPILDFQLDLQKKHELIDALQELKMQEEDVTFLEAEYADTLANAGLIKAEIKHQPQRLERLHQLVVDHWVEYARFKGKALGTTVTNLQQVLRQYEHGIEGVVGFFTQSM